MSSTCIVDLLSVDAGGGKLAEQLVNVYLSVFQLIMKGQIGHAVEVRNAVDAKAEAAKKLAKAGGGRRRPSAREQRRRSKQKPSKHSNGAGTAPANQVHTGRACCVARRQSKSQQCPHPWLARRSVHRPARLCHLPCIAGWPCLLKRSVRLFSRLSPH